MVAAWMFALWTLHNNDRGKGMEDNHDERTVNEAIDNAARKANAIDVIKRADRFFVLAIPESTDQFVTTEKVWNSGSTPEEQMAFFFLVEQWLFERRLNWLSEESRGDDEKE